MNIIRCSFLFYCITLHAVKLEVHNDNTTKTPHTTLLSPVRIFDNTTTATPATALIESRRLKTKIKGTKSPTLMDIALKNAAKYGLNAMTKLYDNIEPEILRNGNFLDDNHPAALLSKFSAPIDNDEKLSKIAFAQLMATKSFQKSYKAQSESEDLGRQATTSKISFRRTALEGLCPQREPPICLPAAKRYRTHDGTCNSFRRPRWGSAQMPFNRFLPPEYGDGVDSIRGAVDGGALSSARFVSLLVHGSREGDAPVTLMLAQWGQLIDHDLTSTAQPRSINGSIPRCCGPNDFHPACFPIKVPVDDPWLSPLKVRCLEFLRSAPAQRRDCVLSWREQTNQVTSYLDASPIYSSNSRTSDNARVFRHGLLLFGRGNPNEDVCHKGALSSQCIRPGDARSSEQPGLMAMHHVWVGEHNRIALELSSYNAHWSDEKVYQETRRIVGALFQHITYREFLPLVLGREVCRLFDLDLLNSGYYTGYDKRINPTIANSFAAAAFRFGHSLVQGTYLRCDHVTLHDDFSKGDIGSEGSLHRLLRGLVTQRALNRDEFISAELTNHLFQSGNFPFGLDLAAINIQRGRDHGVPPYTSWRDPCGLSPINGWEDIINVVGPESAQRIRHAYESVHDIDLFVGGIAERPVVGGLIGPTFACIIAQQFSNLRKGDRFWYENSGFENSFTPAQLHSIRRVSLSQILCRTIGSGSIQAHAFIPHIADGNHRIRCGFGPLAPMDLTPWIEEDPFKSVHIEKEQKQQQNQKEIPQTTLRTLDTNGTIAELQLENINGATDIETDTDIKTFINRIDFIPNGSTGFHKPKDNINVHNKLDFTQTTSTKRPLPQSNHKPTVNNKLDVKVTRLPQAQLIKNKRTTTKRSIVVHNIALELGRTASTLSPILTDANITTNISLDTAKLRVKRTDTQVNSREYLLVSLANKKTSNTTPASHYQVRRKITNPTFYNTKRSTLTTKMTKMTSKNSSKSHELRNFYDYETTTYNRPQNIVIDGLPSDQQIDIEINIRQSNQNKKQQQQQQKQPSQGIPTFDYRPFDQDYNNNRISSPVRNDFLHNPTPSSPFSYRPKTTKPQYFDLSGNSFDFGTTTKQPKIIYINDDNRQSTQRPGFLQTLFSFGNGNANANNNLNKNNIEYDRNEHKPNRADSAIGSTLVTGLINNNGVSGGYESNRNNINKNANSETVVSINIRPALPSVVPTFEYPILQDQRPVQVVIPPKKPNFSNYGYLNPSEQTTTFHPLYSSFLTTILTTRKPYYNSGEIDFRPSNNYRPNYRPTYQYGQHTSGYKEDTQNFPEHKELTNYKGTAAGRSEFNTTTIIDTTRQFDFNITTKMESLRTTTDNITLIRSNISTTDFTDDYYYDTEDVDSEEQQFDKDGYLRPEHMLLNLVSRSQPTVQPILNQTKTTKTVNDNFVVPILNKQFDQTIKKFLEMQSKENNLTENETKATQKFLMTTTTAKPFTFTDTIPRQSLTDITADDFDDFTSSINNLTKSSDRKFVPINVLTKPERPDKWVIFDALNEKPLLPQTPEIISDLRLTTKEFPKPILNNRNRWRKISFGQN